MIPGSPAANATLDRLLGHDEKYGYLAPLRAAARRRIRTANRDWFGVDDLVQNTIHEIIDTLGGPRGAGADTAWVSYVHQRMEDAYRALVGRRGERQDPRRSRPIQDAESGEELDPFDVIDADTRTDWHGNIDPDDTEWFEAFVSRELAKIPNDHIREVAQDLFSAHPSALDRLADRYGVDRFQIHRWREIARTRVYAALKSQNERDIDISWLKPR